MVRVTRFGGRVIAGSCRFSTSRTVAPSRGQTLQLVIAQVAALTSGKCRRGLWCSRADGRSAGDRGVVVDRH